MVYCVEEKIKPYQPSQIQPTSSHSATGHALLTHDLIRREHEKNGRVRWKEKLEKWWRNNVTPERKFRIS
jgi:hypothetical protein